MNPIDAIYRKSFDCKEFEPVPGDFLIKKTSMEIFRDLAFPEKVETALEIGCGSGFNAALLSGMCGRMVATDLPYYDGRTHSLGIKVAQNLIKKLGITNVSLVSCTGEVLPFPDDTFDFVYSSSVLEHIDNKDVALKEMLRVVKPGGAAVFIIPTYVQSVCAFVHLYLYLAKRMLQVIGVKIFRLRPKKSKVLLPTQDDSARASSAILNSFGKSHPSFPLPEPHGSYENIFVEFRSQLPWNWIGFAKRCGAKSVDTFALLFLPFNILEVFSTGFIARAYYYTRHLHRALARSWAQYFSYAWCLVARK